MKCKACDVRVTKKNKAWAVSALRTAGVPSSYLLTPISGVAICPIYQISTFLFFPPRDGSFNYDFISELLSKATGFGKRILSGLPKDLEPGKENSRRFNSWESTRKGQLTFRKALSFPV